MFFNAVALQAQKHRREIRAATNDVISSGVYLEGAQSKHLTAELSDFLQLPTTLVASGHDALVLSLQAAGVGPGDTVVVQANAYPSAFPIAVVGAQILWVDVTLDGQMDPNKLEDILKERRPKAVVLTHLFGATGDVEKISQLCATHSSLLIEDCAQAFGTTYQGKSVGSWGALACYSFYPSKNLGALGDGGAISTASEKLMSHIHQAKQYGEDRRYHSQFAAGHSRLPELQAAGLRVYFSHFAEWQTKKEKVRRRYVSLLKRARLDHVVRVLQSSSEGQPNFHLFVAAVQQRDQLQSFLKKKNIDTLIHYPFIGLDVPGLHAASLPSTAPVARELASQIVSLPFHQYLAYNEIRYVVESLAEFYRA